MGQDGLDRRARERILPTVVGAGLPRLTGWGRVVSAFSRAVNIRHSRGLLASLVEDPHAMTYLSVCVPELFRNHNIRLALGDRIRFEGDRLGTEGFAVELLGRQTWQGTLTVKDVREFDAERISILKEAFLLKGRGGGFFGLLHGDGSSNPFADRAVRVLSRVRKAPLRSVRLGGLSGLVGLGPGSTPSGDDFIAGVLLGEEALKLLQPAEAKAVAHNLAPVIPSPEGKEELRLALNRTNDAGKTLLWQALQGRFPNYLIETLRSVSDAGGKQDIVNAVEKAVGRGATSGTDALAGFLYSMEGRV
jgi:hypothetical protein